MLGRLLFFGGEQFFSGTYGKHWGYIYIGFLQKKQPKLQSDPQICSSENIFFLGVGAEQGGICQRKHECSIKN